MTYQTLKTRRDGRILYVDFDNPPLNLMTLQMVGELFDLAGALAFDQETGVVVLGSANPEFFIAHFELNDLIRSLTDPTVPQSRYDDINALQALATTCHRRLPPHLAHRPVEARNLVGDHQAAQRSDTRAPPRRGPTSRCRKSQSYLARGYWRIGGSVPRLPPIRRCSYR
jgi:hypothetical protein